MSDRSKNSPIRIPINFVESSPPLGQEGTEPYDDAIEIDGDALDLDESPVEKEDDTVVLGGEEPAATVREVEAVDEDTATTGDDESVEEPISVPPVESAGEPAAAPGPQPARPELSIEAFTRVTQELRQKTEQIDRLTVEKNDLYDRLLRKQAEFENFRKRTEREMQEAYRRARADILLDILPSIDNIERALQHADNAEAAVLHEGLALIYKQIADTLGRHGLEAIDSIGKPFDPELHEAVAAEPNDDVEDHTVLAEFQRGYKLGDRLLRPARVKVSVQS